MASCKFDGGKCHGASAVKARLRHNDTSPQMRAEAAKGNPDIDVSKAGLNVRLFGGSYAERCEKYDRRIAQLDSQPGANVRKDRVTGQLIEVPVPPGLPRNSYNDWMRRVVEIQVNKFGKENVIAADGHWDEEHEYIGEDGKPIMSRVHVQLVVVPVVNGRLCGKEFYSRKAMCELNEEVQTMSKAEFDVDFMDGSKKKGKKSTEALKAESAQKASEAAQKAAEELRQAEEARGAAEADKVRVGALKRDLEKKVKDMESSLRWYDGYTERIHSDGPRAAFMRNFVLPDGRTVEDCFQAEIAKDAAEREKAAQAVTAAKAATRPDKREMTREERVASIPTVRETTVDDYYDMLMGIR